jgi:hypothetical protein
LNAVAIPRRVAAVATGLAALMCGWLALLHLRMIVSPAPQEMREGGIIWITRLLLEGRNPYAVAELPAGTDVYGILYHLVVLPFARVFGNGFTVHRTVSAAAIAGSCVLLYRLLRRERTDRLLAAVGVMLFYASSLYFVAPLARPDGLGVFLAMVSMTLVFSDTVTPIRFLIGLAFALLALLTKVYLAYPPFVMAAYVFLFVSRPRGLLYGLASVGAAIALLLVVTTIYPTYINVSIVDNAQSASYYDLDHMKQQTLDWLLFSLPLAAALGLAVARAVTRRPSWTALRPGIFTFASIVNAATFFLVLAGHPGAHMTYLFQLVTPVLMLALLPRLGQLAWPRAAIAAALPIGFALNAHYFPLTFARFSAAEAVFAQLTGVIEAHQNVLGSTEIAGPLALAGRPVVDSGHSQYFGAAEIDRRLPGLASPAVLHARWDNFTGEIAQSITAQQFDLIVRSRRPGLIPLDLVTTHYVRTGTFDLDFPWGAQNWPVDLWEPRR